MTGEQTQKEAPTTERHVYMPRSSKDDGCVICGDSGMACTGNKEPVRTYDLRLICCGTAEFQFDKDGDLEIDISCGTGSERWEGVFLSKEYVLRLRDFLNRALP